MNVSNKQGGDLIDAAIKYAERGLAILPLHYPINSGCSCGNATCSSVGKHPRTAHGVKDATTDYVTINAWYEQCPDANIGIATGTSSGFVVLDVDPRHGGQDSLVQLIEKHQGDFPETICSRTGGDGAHFLFAHPGQAVRNKVGIAPGLDIRADGGYIIAPPSLHASGQRYAWEAEATLDTMPLAPMPAWLLELITASERTDGAVSEGGQPILEGQRNTTLFTLARSMRSCGMGQEAIVAALFLENEQRCMPPLGEDEVLSIAENAARYTPKTSSRVEHTKHLTDLGNAKRLVDRHGHDLRFSPAWDKWVVWNKTIWMVDQTGEVIRRAKDTVEHIFDEVREADDKHAYKALINHAEWSQSEPRLKAMIKLTESEPGISILPEELDADPWLLTVANGTLDLHTGTLREHRRQDLISKRAPVVYDPTATCPTWKAFLDRIMGGNEVLIAFLQRAIGYALTGDTREQCFFLLYGTGANGKSTFLEILRTMMGAYAQQTDFTTFLARRSDAVRNDLARLRGSRFVSAVEVESGRRLDEAVIKQVTGGDAIIARFLFQEFFEFTPQFKLFLAANHRPEIWGTDHAMWRRVRLIPFKQTIPPGERDADLPAKLRAELSGILTWAVQGCLDWQQEGLGAPEEVEDATEDYREEMDPVGCFIEDCCKLDSHAEMSTRRLYKAFERWCECSGVTPMGVRRFGMRLSERGLTKIRLGNSRGWAGLKLIREPDPLQSFLDKVHNSH